MNRNKPTSIILFELGIFLLPYDAMEVMPSTYAPVSVYAFLVSLVFSMINKNGVLKLNKCNNKLIEFFMYVVIVSLITTSVYMDSYGFYVDFLLTFMVGMLVYFSVMYVSGYYKAYYTQGQFFDHLFLLIKKAYYIPILVGFLELGAIKGVFPYGIKSLLNGIFGGWQERLCMTTHEASWASMHMLVFMVVCFYAFIRKKNLKNFILFLVSMFFFFILMSAQGMISLGGGVILFIFLSQMKKGNLVGFLKKGIIALLILSIGCFIFYETLSLDPTSYYARRILNFTSLKDLLLVDSSAFIRVGYLILHVLIFRDYFFFGIGGGNFNYLFTDYVYKYFPRSASMEEVKAHLKMGDAGTTMSIYFSVLSEFGVIGGVLFARFLFGSARKIKELCVEFENIVIFFFAICLALPIQFGSWSYVPWWLALAILGMLEKSWK